MAAVRLFSSTSVWSDGDVAAGDPDKLWLRPHTPDPTGTGLRAELGFQLLPWHGANVFSAGEPGRAFEHPAVCIRVVPG